MDPSPKSFPILSYVMSRIPSLGPKSASDSIQIDIEQPPPSSSSSSAAAGGASSSFSGGLVDHMPHLAHPEVLASMTRAIADVAQTRSVLKIIGDRPDHEAVDTAKKRLAEIESNLSNQLDEIVLSPQPVGVDRHEFKAHLADKEEESRKAAEKEKAMYKAVIGLDEMHEAYEKLLKEAEQRLVQIYRSAEAVGDEAMKGENLQVSEEVNEEVVEILQEASGKGLKPVDLSGKRLQYLPEAFGKIEGLVVLNLSRNQLQAIPDSIAGLVNLEELDVSSNLLESLPDSVGLLHNLKLLNVSGNKLVTLPDAICHCKSLVELDLSYNILAYLPTNLGHKLVDLQRLSIQLNKIRSLPSSICEMRSLQYLDAHFNEIHVLPLAIGKLTNLEVINLSSNFSDLKELPESFGELTNLKELDLSNNQIHALPDTFGRLDNLIKLNVEQNPLEIPPKEVVEKGVEAIKTFMAKRWVDLLVEEEHKSLHEATEQAQTGWLTRSTSWLNKYTSAVSESVSAHIGSPRHPYLDQQL